MIFNRMFAMNDPLLNHRESVQASERRSMMNALRPFMLQRSRLLTLHVLLTTFAALCLASCKKGGPDAKPADVDYYTCTMHPSVKKQNPTDKCPICSMDLVPVKKREVTASERPSVHAQHEAGAVRESVVQPTEFTVPVARQRQIGVSYATIVKRSFTHAIRAVGIAAYDKQRHWDYVARVDGYVKQLFVFSRGELVEKDAPILTIYSPDLLTTQNELVDVLRMREEAKAKGNRGVLQSTEKLVESAKQRLTLWNISDKEIAELETTRKPQEHLTLDRKSTRLNSSH